MEPTTTQARIQELERVRKEINLWRVGATAVVLLTVAGCLGLLYSDAKALMTQGQKQQVFIDHLQAGMNENVVPRLQQVASRTLTEMQPVVQKEFLALNTRVPELTEASLEQLDRLQKTLPERGSKVLDETFDKALREKEPEIRKMFPDATEDQVKTLFTNLGSVLATRSERVSNELLRPHVDEMQRIHENLLAIARTDVKAAQSGSDWEMGLAVFDVLRDDLKDLTLPKRNTIVAKGDKNIKEANR
ncbi:hypothetical protein EON82_01385 [bacterium]|nr:MAG: hypothetical protein EON82_01385 [bacterium]